MIDEQAPKTDFYVKLNSEADMPTALAAFYRQDYTAVADPETGEESTQIEGAPYLVMHTVDYAIDVLGTIKQFRIWADDLADAGIAGASV